MHYKSPMLRIQKFVAKSSLALLSGCLLISVSVLGAEPQKSDELYWQEADMQLDLLLTPDFITRETCQQSFSIFKGCYQALNSLATKAAPSLEVVPKALLSDVNFKTGAKKEELTPDFVLTEKLLASGPKKSLRLATQESQFRDQLIDKELRKIFDGAIMAPIDFPALIEKQLNASNVPEEKKPLVIAQAMNAFVKEALDPHAHVEPAQKIEDTLNSSGVEVIGVGTQLQMVQDKVVITGTIQETSSDKAGIMANDVIERVDGKSVKGLPLKTVRDWIRGPEGSKIKLEVSRVGTSKPLEFILSRELIVVPKITVETMDIFGSKYAVVKISSFTERKACNQVEEGLEREMGLHKDLAGVILDVRDDPGGLLQQSVCIGSLFVGQRIVAKVKDIGSDRFEDYVGSRRAITDLPVVTLINSGSASASEVLAGALQDYHRAWIVGDQSFGKGTVQTKRRITSKVHLYRTTSRFYQPSGRTNQIEGISPDFPVYEKPNPTEDEKFSVREKDAYTNALEPIGKVWVQERGAEVGKISACRNRDKKAESAFAMDPNADYQLMVAAEVLGCDPIKSVTLR